MGRFRRSRVADPNADRERFNFTRDIIEDLACDAYRPAFLAVDGEGVIDRRTFRELADGAARWSSLLRTYGLEPGDRVLVHIGNSPPWPAILFGALKAGIVVVPCPETATPDELELAAVASGARLAVTDRAHEPALAAVQPELRRLLAEDAQPELRAEQSTQPTSDTYADEVAILVYDAADRDRPIATSYTHAYTSALKEQAEYWLDAQPRDTVWCTAPAGSPLSIRALLGPMSRGAAVVLKQGPLEPDDEIALIERLGVTVLCWVPEELRRMAEGAHHAGVITHLRLAVSEGAALDPDVAVAFRETFRVSVRDGTGYGAGVVHSEQVHGVRVEREPVVQAVAEGPTEEERRREEEARAQTEAEEARRLAAAQAREAEERRKADEKAAAAQAKDDERRRKDEQKAAAAEARLAEEAARQATREAERQRQADEAQAHRLAAAQAKDEERRRKADESAAAAQAKEDERRRKADGKAAAEEARRAEESARQAAREAEHQRKADESEARRLAAAQAKDDERRRKDEEKAAAEEARRAEESARQAAREAEQQRNADESEARRLAAAQAKDDERRRKDEERERKDAARRARKASEQASPAPAPIGSQNGDGAHEPEPVHDSPLVRRLQAYGRSAESPDSVAPAE